MIGLSHARGARVLVNGSAQLARELGADGVHLTSAQLKEAGQRPDLALVGIVDGDLLAVQKAKEAKNGQIVVARVDDEVTVKRFRKTRIGIELIPENPDFKTLLVTPDQEFELEGLAVGLIRNNMLM